MAERSTSKTDHRTLPDRQNFEHGVVSSDAVYVPHSKQSYRGRRGRGKLSGNYRQGQQQNDSLDRSESDGLKQSVAGSKYSAGRGQKLSGRHNQCYGQRNVRSAAYERRQLPDSGEALFGDDSGRSEFSVADRNASFGASADVYNGMDHSRSDETEFSIPSFHVQEHVENSRAPRRAFEDHRYKGRRQRRDVDQQSSHRGRHAYSGGRGYRGPSNYFSDEKFVPVCGCDASLQVSGSGEAVAGYEASNKTKFYGVTVFTNSDHINYGSKAQFSRKLKSSSENPTLRDGKCDVQGPSTAGHDSNCVSDDLQFHDLRISNPPNMPEEVNTQQPNGRAVFNVRVKKSDPEFETQRGNRSLFLI